MPLPTPSKGEERNTFISRCISKAVGDGMPQEQAVAACHTSWRKAKGIKEPKSKMNLKFNYQVPIIESAFVNDEFIITGVALNATVTSNNHKFLGEELRKSADTLSGVPLLIDHRNEVEAIKGRVLSGEFDEEGPKVNFRAHVIDNTMKEMIKDGRINSVSVGAAVEDLEETEDGFFIPRGIEFKELSLVAVAADAGATFTIALQEAYRTSTQTEAKYIQQLNISGGKIMESEDKTENEQEVKTDEETKEEPKEEVKDEGVTEEKLRVMIEKAVKKAVKSADEDEEKTEDKTEDKSEDASEDKTEDTTEDTEDTDEESSEDEVAEEKYKIVQSHGSLKGGAFTLVRT